MQRSAILSLVVLSMGITQATLADTSGPDQELVDKAIAGQYPPGSTFKMIVALAALGSGPITVDAVLGDANAELIITSRRPYR